MKIDNVPYQTDVSDIEKIFSEWGEVGDVYIPRNYDTGKPRGFAFVRYYKKADIERALLGAHGKVLNGRDMRVVRANSEPRRRWFGCYNKESRNPVKHTCASASEENMKSEQTSMISEEEDDESEMDLVLSECTGVTNHRHIVEEKKSESITRSQAMDTNTIKTTMTENEDRRKSTRRRPKPDRLEYVALGKQKDC